MNLFVSFDGDSVGARAGQALLHDDVAEVRRISQCIEDGENLWRNWAVTAGGVDISAGGDEGCVQIPIDKLPEIEGIRSKYNDIVGATCSVGLGMKMSEASKALMVAKLRGKNRVCLWDPSMQPELDDAAKQPESEANKIADHYLTKADLHLTGKNRGSHAGFSGHHGGGAPSKDKPKVSQGDHESAKVVEHEIEAAKAGQIAPEETHSATDFESSLHSAAQDQEKEDGNSEVSNDHEVEQIKQRIVAVLGEIKSQMPMLAQIRQSAPDTYQTIMNLVQGVIMLGKQVMKDQPQPPADDEPQHVQAALGKSDGCDACGAFLGVNHDCPTCAGFWKQRQLAKAVSQILPGPQIRDAHKRETFDYSHVLPAGEQAKGLKLHVSHIPASEASGEHLTSTLYHNNDIVGDVTGHILPPRDSGEAKAVEPHSSLDENYHGRGLGSAMYEALYAHAKNKIGAAEVRGGIHSPDAHALHARLAKKHGFQYNAQPSPGTASFGYSHGPYNYAIKAEAEPVVHDRELCGPGKGITFYRQAVAKDELPADDGDMEKAAGANVPTHHHLKLPVGSTHNGEIKVAHADGKVGWVGVNSGMIAGQEPGAPNTGANTHPVSERKPSAK